MIGPPLVRREEDVMAFVPPLGDLVPRVRDDDSRDPWHDTTLPRRTPARKGIRRRANITGCPEWREKAIRTWEPSSFRSGLKSHR